MHDQFEATRQGTLGRSIVEAVQEEERMDSAVQEQIGRAVMQVTQAQERYGAARDAQETQLAGAALAAVRANALMEQLTPTEEVAPAQIVVAHHTIASADISRGSLILACMGLIILFVGGLAFGTKKSDVETIPVWKMETILQLHRSGR